MNYFLFGGFILTLLFGQSVSAASLYIDPGQTTLYRGDEIRLAVRLDTDEANQECVNAVDGVISYSDNIQPVDVSIGTSIFPIWVEKPVINPETKQITFAGGIPNGCCGRVSGDPRLTNTVVELVFRSPGLQIGGSDESEARIDILPQSMVYLNDGRGTVAPLSTYGAKITLLAEAGSTMTDPWRAAVRNDVIPPESFSVSLEKGDTAFSGKYFIVFNTTDKQTGIDQYQVMEEPLTEFGQFAWGRADAPWVEVRSPYVLKDQTLNSTIRVKALDKAGNEYIATLVPEEGLRSMSHHKIIQYSFWGGAGIIITLIIIIIFIGVRRWQIRRVSFDNDSQESP